VVPAGPIVITQLKKGDTTMVVVGIDAHKRSHTAVAVDDAGRKLGQHTTGTTSDEHLSLLSGISSAPAQRSCGCRRS
jgi:hypothetical protein